MNLKKRYIIELPSLLTLGFVLILGLIIGYLGPFGSYAIQLPVRLLYWVISIFIGYFVYSQTLRFAQWYFVDKKVHPFIKFIIPSFCAALLLSFFTEFLTSVFFNVPKEYRTNFYDYFLQVFIVGVIISFIISQFHKNIRSSNSTSSVTRIQPGKVFLDRLPHAIGDELMCFVMEDHYLKVYTKKGEHMLLMRMKDALVELADYNGMQVHRSWWVAQDAVSRFKKSGRNTVLVLDNNREVPVSKTYLKLVKERLV